MSDSKSCPHCGGEILSVAKKCKHCKEFIADVATKQPDKNDFASVIGMIHRKDKAKIWYHPGVPIGMFALTNIAICLSVTVVTLGNVRLALFALLLGICGPLISLLMSKYLAKKAFKFTMIEPDKFRDDTERRLYFLVKTLADKAGLAKVPELGIYKSPDMNAFATGKSRSDSMIGFSSAIVEKMDDDALAAVAAHEIAHIANGDMLTMTLMQSVVNTVIMLIDLALYFMMDDRRDGVIAYLLKLVVRLVVVGFLMFLGNLLLLWFSRHREFKADKLAAELVKADAMVKALETLGNDENIEIPDDVAESQQAYAAFKISSSPAMLDVFSTHPSLPRRIEKLKQQH